MCVCVCVCVFVFVCVCVCVCVCVVNSPRQSNTIHLVQECDSTFRQAMIPFDSKLKPILYPATNLQVSSGFSWFWLESPVAAVASAASPCASLCPVFAAVSREIW